MRLLLLNPNATQAMTDSIAATAAAIAPEAEILSWTNINGPAAIQGPEDGARAVPGLLAMLPRAEAAEVDGIVIACFDDTGLAEMRAATQTPVIGIGQAAYHMATLRSGEFTVLTTLQVSVPVIEDNIRDLGFAPHCGGVIASGIPVLEVEEGRAPVLSHLSQEVARLSQEAKSIVLGCAGMSRHLPLLQKASRVPVIDPVAAATGLGLALARM